MRDTRGRKRVRKDGEEQVDKRQDRRSLCFPPAKVSRLLRSACVTPPTHTHTESHKNDHRVKECAGPWPCSLPPTSV